MKPIEEFLSTEVFYEHLKTKLENIFIGNTLPNIIYEHMLKGHGEWFLDAKVEIPVQSLLWRDCVWICHYPLTQK
jgi:hypothetical protein